MYTFDTRLQLQQLHAMFEVLRAACTAQHLYNLLCLTATQHTAADRTAVKYLNGNRSDGILGISLAFAAKAMLHVH
jgi:hypothetical protein